jgi:GH15 family glucan-1,4-alpha-glucosidase
MTTTPIADYAVISDCHTAALVSKDGSIDWLCTPRFDSPSLFGRLLGESAGHWSIRPSGDATFSRGYIDRTMVLETTVRTPEGAATLTEAMALGPTQSGHDLGSGAPGVVLRLVEGLEGSVEFDLEFVPRPGYGLVPPRLAAVDGGVAVRGEAGAGAVVLSTPIEARLDGYPVVRQRFTVRTGQSVGFAVHHGESPDPPRTWSQEEIAGSVRNAVEHWRAWASAHQRYEGPWRDLVYHSGRVLQALTFQPTGAMVAAPTTSLPEVVGGERNWDYRYSWIRDASFTLDALWVAACPDEAGAFFSWMARVASSGRRLDGDLQIMFGISGDEDLTERTLDHLPGWRDSRPVRVGNAAWKQRQLDVFGELLAAAERLTDQLSDLDDETRRFFVDVADAAARRWGEPDHGIWEIRDEPRHFVYSKLMCWVALDRAIRMATLIGAEDRIDEWAATREEIRTAILDRGWSGKAGAFAQSFGSDQLDASNLMMAIVGFLPADDARMVATIEAIERDLTDDHGLVYRYLADDGLPGEEGTFVLCTFWLAHALALAGKPDRARATFERAVAYANDVGLLSEQVDEATGELLGNFPQAFSHIGLINAAWAISEAERTG